MSDNVALIAGVGGTCGSNLAEMLHRDHHWKHIIGISRSNPRLDVPIDHRAVDLLDKGQCNRLLGDLSSVTHIFWTALINGKTRTEENTLNTTMFENFMDAALPRIPGLQHVHVLEGIKQYGYDLGPYKTPCREDDPDGDPPYFYTDQHAHTLKCRSGQNWTWSTSRPGAVCGYAYRGRINLTNVIAVYASIMKELGEPLHYPGDDGTFGRLTFATDVRILNRLMIWASTDPRAANQAYNVANGDHFRWEHMWPRIASMFEMPMGEVRPMDLVAFMESHSTLWDDMVRRHGLRETKLMEIAPWPYANIVFRRNWDSAINTVKANRFGFTEMIDTEDMFRGYIEQFRAARIIP
ncbi:NAD-dependent epimerase/dehydratase family protein [Castellaniella sp.]|uniref:NAD-dependent epimerase/dehydratase family protein n=1 Tax=Castellaniella sp. TaxID=1955812 RepID=UPI00355CA5BE